MQEKFAFQPGDIQPLLWQVANHALTDPNLQRDKKRPYVAEYIDSLFDELRLIAERREREGCTDPSIHLGYVASRASDSMRLTYGSTDYAGCPFLAPADTFNALYAQAARTYVHAHLGKVTGLDLILHDR